MHERAAENPGLGSPATPYERWCRFMFRRSRQHVVAGITVGIDADSEHDADLALDKISAAIQLIAQYDEPRWARFRSDVGGILVEGAVGSLGEWLPGIRLVRVKEAFVQADRTSIADIASTLAHEGTHAQLWRRGFRYPEDMRARIEAVCVRSQIRFLRRLPDAADTIQRAGQGLSIAPEYWTNESFGHRKIENLIALEAPKWLVAIARWFIRWKLWRAARQKNGAKPDGPVAQRSGQ